jgi:hypothetical protein
LTVRARRFFKMQAFRNAPVQKSKRRGAFLVLWVLMALWLSGCLPEGALLNETPTPTPTHTGTPSPTATVVWFPPTVTYTPFPTRPLQPTPDWRPAVTDLLVEDDFDNAGLWAVSRTGVGSAAYGKGEFTLAVTAPKGMVSSLRAEPVLSAYYLEVDVFPSLCRAADAYGVLLRAETPQDFYRLVLTCGGQARIERVREGRVTPLQEWLDAGIVAPGPLVKTRLGVWHLNEEIRVFVNDNYVYTLRDRGIRTGGIGLVARAGGDSPLTVNFSRLRVWAVDPALVPTITPTPTVTVRPTSTMRPTQTPQP